MTFQATKGTAGAAARGSFANLLITRPSAATVTITADDLVLFNANGAALRAASVNVTIDITASGANGLDTGAEASSTQYYIWIISNGSTTAGILSASSSAPTMPAGYTYKALVSGAYNDGSSNLINFVQEGREYWYNAFRSMASGTVSRWTSVTTTTFCPAALSTLPYLQLIATTNQNAAVTNDNSVSTDTGNLGPNMIACAGNGGNSPIGQIRIITANTLYWGSTSGTLYCAGFTINKL